MLCHLLIEIAYCSPWGKFIFTRKRGYLAHKGFYKGGFTKSVTAYNSYSVALFYLKAYGNKSVYPDTVAMTTNTVIDLASLTKVASTAMSMAHLLEKGGFRLEDKVNKYIPELQPWVDPKTGEKVDIRIVDLLTHSSGLPSYANTAELIERYGVAHPDTLMSYINTVPRLFRPTTKYEYS